MKPFLIFVFALAAPLVAGTAQASASDAGCDHVIVRAEAQVAGDEVFLSDLLDSGTSLTLRKESSRVRLGDTPLTGSARVLDGAEIRALLDHLEDASGKSRCRSWNVPERITVRRAGRLASCTDLIERIRPLLSVPVSFNLSPHDVNCGAAGRIPQDAPVEVTATAWNPALASWDIRARCIRPSDCVPFLLRVHAGQARSQSLISEISDRLPAPASPRSGNNFANRRNPATPRSHAVVHAGQALTLIWDGNGIRVAVPVLCLEAGEPGQQVRARIVGGATIVRAVVINAESLRAIS